MDIFIRNIKTFVCLAPKKHTAHKTMRVPCFIHGQALFRVYKPPPDICRTFGGLLNVNFMAVDFAGYRKNDRLFLFMRCLSGNRYEYGCWLTYISAWQCYIAKYP